MLHLESLEIEGFGPFADAQSIVLPSGPGVTVVYGENMRGKTSLLNAIRYAFFGTVLGRGARQRRLHTITNRDRAAQGQFGFSVALTFRHNGVQYELVRECRPTVKAPTQDDDYAQTVLLRRGSAALGPQERDRALNQIFPGEISRFFLFDGELLQEYEELLVNESESGHRISEAIERILGVPVLKRGRQHLTQLADDADKIAAKEASKRQETQALGTALAQSTEQKGAHQKELGRLTALQTELQVERTEIEQSLQSIQKYAGLLQERDDITGRLHAAVNDETTSRSNLQRAMSSAWRSLLRAPLVAAREFALAAANRQIDQYVLVLRRRSLDSGICEVCEQGIPREAHAHLKESLSIQESGADSVRGAFSNAMANLATLNRITDTDNTAQIRELSARIDASVMEQVALKDRLSDVNAALSDADPEAIRRTRSSYSEVSDKIASVKRGIEDEAKKIEELEQNIVRIRKKLEASGGRDLVAVQSRARILRSSAEVFSDAIDRYKISLRSKVELTATQLFLSMTTEKRDFAGLSINESYGLTIMHKDGRAEEARSAGAEHVVALALMGALQKNAPLRGPIVMDSPFGRLDEEHTSNVVRTLPRMAEQVVLLVYEAEVGKQQVRELLGTHLAREYELERVSSRRTNIREVR